MPNVGDETHGNKVGKASRDLHVWILCPQCKRGRWIAKQTLKTAKRNGLCVKCLRATRGEKSLAWKGGRWKSLKGYIYVRLSPDDFFYPMANINGCVFEHRLVVAKALGRCLHRWEIVHHKRGCAKDDNRYPETLTLYSIDRHNQMTILEARITYLEEQICRLTKNARM